MNKRRQDRTGLTKYDQNCMCWNHRSGPYLFSETTCPMAGKISVKSISGDRWRPAATAAVAIARLGIDVDFIGRVGDDSCGNTLLNELQSWGQYRVLPAIPELPFIPVRNFGRPAWRTHYRELSKPSLDTGGCRWLESIDFSHYDIVSQPMYVVAPEGTLKSFELARAAGVLTLLDADMTPQRYSPLWRLPSCRFSTPGRRE